MTRLEVLCPESDSVGSARLQETDDVLCEECTNMCSLVCVVNGYHHRVVVRRKRALLRGMTQLSWMSPLAEPG